MGHVKSFKHLESSHEIIPVVVIFQFFCFRFQLTRIEPKQKTNTKTNAKQNRNPSPLPYIGNEGKNERRRHRRRNGDTWARACRRGRPLLFGGWHAFAPVADFLTALPVRNSIGPDGQSMPSIQLQGKRKEGFENGGLRFGSL